MNVRIGIADTGREIEVEIDDRDEFVSSLNDAFDGSEKILWFHDTKGNEVGIPLERIAFVEIIDVDGPSVGFSR